MIIVWVARIRCCIGYERLVVKSRNNQYKSEGSSTRKVRGAGLIGGQVELPYVEWNI